MTYSVEEKIRTYVDVEHDFKFPFVYDGFYYSSVKVAVDATGPAAVLREVAEHFWECNDLNKMKQSVIDRITAIRNKPIYVFTLGGLIENYNRYSFADSVEFIVDELLRNGLKNKPSYVFKASVSLRFYRKLTEILDGIESVSDDIGVEDLFLHRIFREIEPVAKLQFSNINTPPPDGYVEWLVDYKESLDVEYTGNINTITLKSSDDEYINRLYRHWRIPSVYLGDPEGIVNYISKRITKALAKRGVHHSPLLEKYLFNTFLEYGCPDQGILGHINRRLTWLVDINFLDKLVYTSIGEYSKIPEGCIVVDQKSVVDAVVITKTNVWTKIKTWFTS